MNRENFKKLSRKKKILYLSLLLNREPIYNKKIITFNNYDLEVKCNEIKKSSAFAPTDLQSAYLYSGSSGLNKDLFSGQDSFIYQEFELTGINIKRLGEAWNNVIETHAMMRASIGENGLLIINDEYNFYEIPIEDATEASEKRLSEIRNSIIRKKIEFRQWPLFYFSLSKINDNHFRAHIKISLLIADGKSIRNIYKELTEFYENSNFHVRSTAISFLDYLSTKSSYIKSSHAMKSKEYWRNKFSDLASLPSVHKKMTVSLSDEKQRVETTGCLRISSSLRYWKKLKIKAREMGVEPIVVLLCAYEQVISLWSGRRQFGITLVSWKRPKANFNLDEVVGDFTGLCWHVANQDGRSFAEKLVEADKTIALDIRHNAVSPLSELRKIHFKNGQESGIEFPIVMTDLFSDLGAGTRLFSNEGYGLTNTSHVLLDCINVECGESLNFHWDYVAEAFDREDIKKFFLIYEQLLNYLSINNESWKTLDIERMISNERFLGPKEASKQEDNIVTGKKAQRHDDCSWQYKQLYEWNNTYSEFNRNVCIHQLFERQVEKYPSNIATYCNGTCLTYLELNGKSNQLAKFLIMTGVKRGQLIGVCIERSHDLIIALLAILKAGCAYVPLEPSQSKGRIATIVEKAEIQLILTKGDYRKNVEGLSAKVYCLEDEAERIESHSSDNLNLKICQSNNIAYVIFTSGSTGTPKGVVVRHRPVINLIEWVEKKFKLSAEDVVLFTTSIGFDLSVFDIFGMLAVGGKIHIVDDKNRKNVEKLAALLCNEDITFWDSAPAALNMLLPFLKKRNGSIKNEKLRLVFLSGDWIPMDLPDEIRSYFRDAKVISLGGATEATVWSNYFPIDKIDSEWRSIPYGRPIQNARYYILNENLQPCPVGVEGDLYIGGECLSDGYLNNEELTKKSFIKDPYSNDVNAIMYKTGDLARFFPDGIIEFLGRNDFQVKIRGHRIELGDIEHRLRSHKDIKDAVTVVKEDIPGDQKLVAYVIGKGGNIPSMKELREFLGKTLPDYMVPNMMVPIESLPVTENGKLDRKALSWPPRAIDQDSVISAREGAEDKGDLIGDFIHDNLCKQLSIKKIDRFSDIFDDGVTSINIVRLISEVQTRYKVNISIDEILKAPNIDAIGKAVVSKLEQVSIEAKHPSIAKVEGVEDTEKQTVNIAIIIENLSKFLQERLSCGSIGMHDDIFDFGATSLNVLQLIQEIDNLYQVKIDLNFILELPTLGSIARYIEASGGKRCSTVEPDESTSQLFSETSYSEIPYSETIRSVSRSKYQYEDGAIAETCNQWKFNLTDFSKFESKVIELDKDETYLSSLVKNSEAKSVSGKTSISRLGRFLSLLKQRSLDGMIKYLYPSSGGLYSIQLYIAVKPNGVEGLDEGVFYYHPVRNTLYKISAKYPIDNKNHNLYHRSVHTNCDYSLLFIAQTNAIRPIYPELCDDLIMIDTGYMAQLLLDNQSNYDLWLKPAISFDFESVREAFRLESSHVFTLCLLGGAKSSDLLPSLEQKSAGKIQSTNINMIEFMTKEKISFTGHHAVGYRQNPVALEHGLRFLSEDDQTKIKQKQTHLRYITNEKHWVLESEECDSVRLLKRSCKREYLPRKVTFEEISKFFMLVKGDFGVGREPCSYSSLNGNYIVQIYVAIRSEAANEIEGGFYYYNPIRHAMHKIASDHWNSIRKCHLPFNRNHFDKACFSIFLMSNLKELEPAYGKYSLCMAQLQSGMIGQTMMDHQAESGIGICPVAGVVGFEQIINRVNIDKNSVLLQSFVGGAVDYEWQKCEMLGDSSTGNIADLPGRLQYRDNIQGKNLACSEDKIAIVGMSCRFPSARDIEQYWSNISTGCCSFGYLSEHRRMELQLKNVEGGNSPYWGAFLDDISKFDYKVFGISPSESRAMDPQERQFLEVAWECLEAAGYSPEQPVHHSARMGVFIGVMWSDYQALNTNGFASSVLPSSFHSAIANRVSHFFDFKGPSLAVDTSCSSGLTAIHLACESINRGECDQALVGAVNLFSNARHYELLKYLDLLSDSNANMSFSAQADGWVMGEGVAAILIKPKSSAERAGDTIHGLIAGSAIGHTGKTCRYGVPSSVQVAESIDRFLTKLSVPIDTISYVECAAPGASVSDATELSAISQIFSKRSSTVPPCAIGSVKPNIGHLESAATLSQLIKVVQQIKYRKIAPTIFNGEANPMAKIAKNKLFVIQELTDWDSFLNDHSGEEQAVPLRAMVNSMGASGSYGHLLVEEYRQPIREAGSNDQPVPILLSADSDQQLKLLLQKFCDYLGGIAPNNPPIADIGYTLLVGRKDFIHRFATVVNSTDELISRITDYLREDRENEFIFVGKALSANPVRIDLKKDNILSAVRQWVEGKVKPIPMGMGRRVTLPTYPFNESRCWITETDTNNAVSSSDARNRDENNIYTACKGAVTGDGDFDAVVIQKVENYIKNLFSSASGVPVEQIDLDIGLETYGIDSLIINKVNAALGSNIGKLPKTILFEYRTLAGIRDYLLENYRYQIFEYLNLKELSLAESEISKPVPAQSLNTRHCLNADTGSVNGKKEDIAIIGISGRYPKANTLEEFWINIRDGIDCITEIPIQRWDYRETYSENQSERGKSYCKWGGFIDDYDKFDTLFFNISPAEAVTIDPQERLFLELVWELLENTGYSKKSLAEDYAGDVGVFVGVMYGEYQFYGVENALKGSPMALNSAYGSIANRVSHFFDLHGPSMAIDTMCASSLTALHIAVNSLYVGDCTMAIVGGINLTLHPNKYLMLSRLKMASPSGSCKSFSSGADGFVPGEGGGALLLKPLSLALRHEDDIKGVVKSTSINHGGKTNGYTVPSPNQQANLILKSLQKVGINPRNISYVEAHGTGTSLGDPIEIAGLSKAFSHYTSERAFCALGSVKSNIGHLEAASGIAGITKILLQFKHKKLVPSIHAENLNPNVEFESSQFYVQRELQGWFPESSNKGTDGRRTKRLAMLNSFGAGGAYANAIIEEYEMNNVEREIGEGRPEAFLLSAKTPSQLVNYAKRMRDFLSISKKELENNERQLLLADIAYTSQVGRNHLDVKLAIVTTSIEHLERTLSRFCEKQESTEDVKYWRKGETLGVYDHMLSGREGKKFIDALIESLSLYKLVELWGSGIEIDWIKLPRTVRVKKVQLPNCPLEKQRCWIEEVRDHTYGIKKDISDSKETVSSLSLPEVISDNRYTNETEENSIILMQPVWRKDSSLETEINGLNVIFSSNEYLCNGILREMSNTSGLFARFGATYQSKGCEYTLRPTELDDYKRLFNDVFNDKSKKVNIIYLWESSPMNEKGCEQVHINGLLKIVQALSSIKHESKIAVTVFNQVVNDSSRDIFFGVYGFLRTAIEEIPKLSFKVVEIEDYRKALTVNDYCHLVMQEAQKFGVSNKRIKYSGGERYATNYALIGSDEFSQSANISQYLRQQGVYLITGGSGKIGLHVARHIAGKAGIVIVLIGKSAMSASLQEELSALKVQGCDPIYMQVDISIQEEVKRLVNSVKKTYGWINGIFHAAGVIRDSSMVNKTEKEIMEVLGPKILGAVWLDHILQEERLDFFVLFSSVVATIGNPGQIDYAFANAYLNSFAQWRSDLCEKKGNDLKPKRFGNTISIGWPYWKGGGMQVDSSTLERFGRRTGIEPMSTRQGLRMLDQLMVSPYSQIDVFCGNQEKIEQYLREDIIDGNSYVDLEKSEASVIFTEVNGKGITTENLLEYLICSVANVTGIDIEKMDNEAKFDELGINSIMVVSLIDGIERTYDIKLYPNEFVVYNTVSKLHAYLQAELAHSKSKAAIPIVYSEVKETKPTIFVLSSPRSGSTLLRVILMGHSQVFAPPELHLLQFEALKERKNKLEKSNQLFLREGLIESIKVLKGISASEAIKTMETFEAQDISIAQVYQYLKQHIAGRYLVDKSPTYAYDLTTLKKSASIDANAFYIFLLRHPVSVIESFVRNRFDKMLSMNGNAWEEAEKMWYTTNSNIYSFLRNIPDNRQHLMIYEDLVQSPRAEIKSLCDSLGIEYESEMLNPYQGDRMLNGLHNQSMSIGDPRFLNHKKIDSSLAFEWRKHADRIKQLKQETLDLAIEMGYSMEDFSLEDKYVG